MKTGKERQAWLDYVRFFSIFLVIVFHTPPRLELFDEAVILNLRVPVFFCISGFLYSFDKWPRFWIYARHRAKQILIPYCTFFIIFYVLWLFVGRQMVGASEQAISVWQPVKEFVLGNPKVVTAPFWYIACLFCMQIAYYWVERLVPRRFVFITCVFIAVATYFWPKEGGTVTRAIYDFWNLGNALLFLPFYALGNSFKPALSKMEFNGAIRTIGLLVLAAASMAGMAWITTIKSWNPDLYGIVRVAAGLLVIPAYMCCAKVVAKHLGHRRVIEFVVVSGTVYLGLQNYFIGIAKLILNKIFYVGIIDDQWWLKFVIAAAVMVAIYPFALFIDRYTPWLIGKGKFFDKY